MVATQSLLDGLQLSLTELGRNIQGKVAAKHSKKTGKAKWALNHIRKLYRIEEAIKTLPVEERYKIRQEKAVPLLMQFKTWLDKSAPHVLPESLLGKALNYALN